MPEPMPISPEGLALVKHFEGYHEAQPDGSCVAYLCPAGVPTIGWGCTHGVQLGMRWTRDEAEAALMRELEVYARAVDRHVTVPLTTQQRDALVSFTFNLGETNLRKSTLLRKLNAGDYDGAEREFARWVKASKGAGGPKVVYAGLVRRRKAEAAMFADNEVVPVPLPEIKPPAQMPQAPAPKTPKVPWWSGIAAGISAAGAWFSSALEGVSGWLVGTGDQFVQFAPVTSMVAQAGLHIGPILIGLATLSGVIALKTMMKPDEVVE